MVSSVSPDEFLAPGIARRRKGLIECRVVSRVGYLHRHRSYPDLPARDLRTFAAFCAGHHLTFPLPAPYTGPRLAWLTATRRPLLPSAATEPVLCAVLMVQTEGSDKVQPRPVRPSRQAEAPIRPADPDAPPSENSVQFHRSPSCVLGLVKTSKAHPAMIAMPPALTWPVPRSVNPSAPIHIPPVLVSRLVRYRHMAPITSPPSLRFRSLQRQPSQPCRERHPSRISRT